MLTKHNQECTINLCLDAFLPMKNFLILIAFALNRFSTIFDIVVLHTYIYSFAVS